MRVFVLTAQQRYTPAAISHLVAPFWSSHSLQETGRTAAFLLLCGLKMRDDGRLIWGQTHWLSLQSESRPTSSWPSSLSRHLTILFRSFPRGWVLPEEEANILNLVWQEDIRKDIYSTGLIHPHSHWVRKAAHKISQAFGNIFKLITNWPLVHWWKMIVIISKRKKKKQPWCFCVLLNSKVKRKHFFFILFYGDCSSLFSRWNLSYSCYSVPPTSETNLVNPGDIWASDLVIEICLYYHRSQEVILCKTWTRNAQVQHHNYV